MAKQILSASAERDLLDVGVKVSAFAAVVGVSGWIIYTQTDIGRAADAKANIGPASVGPNSFVTLQGTFLDHSGKPTMVFQGHYKVYDAKTSKVVQEGILGNFITDFSVQIPTANMPDGPYAIGISDRNIIDELFGAPVSASNMPTTTTTTTTTGGSSPSAQQADSMVPAITINPNVTSSKAGYFYPVKI